MRPREDDSRRCMDWTMVQHAGIEEATREQNSAASCVASGTHPEHRELPHAALLSAGSL